MVSRRERMVMACCPLQTALPRFYDACATVRSFGAICYRFLTETALSGRITRMLPCISAIP
jgi:hypothetical protein